MLVIVVICVLSWGGIVTKLHTNGSWVFTGTSIVTCSILYLRKLLKTYILASEDTKATELRESQGLALAVEELYNDYKELKKEEEIQKVNEQ